MITHPLANLKKTIVTPGGIVFETESVRYAFTFQNPLVAADVLQRAKT